jgi:hypothetical protein
LFFVICFLLFAFLFFFILTQVCSGRMAFILRSVAAGGFKQGLQHDCHEALTYILSTAHEEEIKFRNQRQRCSSSQIPEGAQIPACFGVVAKSFGIQERIELMVRARSVLFCSVTAVRQPFNAFRSALIVAMCAQNWNLVLLFLFLWGAAPVHEN